MPVTPRRAYSGLYAALQTGLYCLIGRCTDWISSDLLTKGKCTLRHICVMVTFQALPLQLPLIAIMMDMSLHHRQRWFSTVMKK